MRLPFLAADCVTLGIGIPVIFGPIFCFVSLRKALCPCALEECLLQHPHTSTPLWSNSA